MAPRVHARRPVAASLLEMEMYSLTGAAPRHRRAAMARIRNLILRRALAAAEDAFGEHREMRGAKRPARLKRAIAAS
jgi:hypothetical protein